MTRFPPAVERYLASGLRVLPLSPRSKIPPGDPPGTPKGKGGVHLATVDRERLAELFSNAGPGAGIGLVPGPRYWVSDLDTHPPKAHPEGIDGLAAIDLLMSEGRVLPETRTASTPNGGLHLWWLVGPGQECPRPRSSGTLVLGKWAGIDVRSVGSYVVVPPTVITRKDGTEGRYSWVKECPCAVAPDWFHELFMPLAETLPPVPAREYRGMGTSAERYADRVLDTCVERCADPSDGAHSRLWTSSVTMGGYIGGGHIARSVVEAALVAAGKRARPNEKRVEQTVHDGINKGLLRPCNPPER